MIPSPSVSTILQLYLTLDLFHIICMINLLIYQKEETKRVSSPEKV